MIAPRTNESSAERNLSMRLALKMVSAALKRFPDDTTHPLQIALRTYGLALSLSLGPALVSLFPKKTSKPRLTRLKVLLRRELSPTGFAFAITIAVGGGAALQHLWNCLGHTALRDGFRDESEELPLLSPDASKSLELPDQGTMLSIRRGVRSRLRRLSAAHRGFIANIVSCTVSVFLLQAGRRRSKSPALSGDSRGIPDGVPIPLTVTAPLPTLDLTLLMFVRALDASVQTFLSKTRDDSEKQVANQEGRKRRKERMHLTMRIDALIFWACSARIMWCFFYEPQRLPRSYVKWITSLANVDRRLLDALRAIRRNEWSYVRSVATPPDLLTEYAMDLGFPPTWADPAALPAYGGEGASLAWQKLGVKGRDGVGGIPCEMVHANITKGWGVGHGCVANAGIRGAYAFLQALAIYLPVHFLPVLLTRPHSLLRLRRLVSTLLGALRSAAFLSTFLSSYWFAVCSVRSLFLARILPKISHDVWDGPLGCMLAGSLLCGNSIWVENGRRRGEIALYVLPRAIRTCLPERWLKTHVLFMKWAERIVFVLSLSSILTMARQYPHLLRGLSRWTCAFVMNGPNVGFWKRKKADSETQTSMETFLPDATENASNSTN